jgi:hypothetical protein
MAHIFNLSRYKKLLAKETALVKKKKSLLTENRPEYFELLDSRASIEEQMNYNRRNDYFLLIDKYLNQLITPFDFQIEFLKLEKNDSRKALEDEEQLSTFSLVDNLKEFSNLMGKIYDLCEDVFE